MSGTTARTRASAVITVHKYGPSAYDQPTEGPVLTRIHVEESFPRPGTPRRRPPCNSEAGLRRHPTGLAEGPSSRTVDGKDMFFDGAKGREGRTAAAARVDQEEELSIGPGFGSSSL